MGYRTTPESAPVLDPSSAHTVASWHCPGCRRVNGPCSVDCERCRTARPELGDEERERLLQLARSINTWARSQLLFSLRLSSHITSVTFQGQQLERIFTEVAHRHVQEVRVATRHTGTTSSRIDGESIDPFAFTLAELREGTEHVSLCNQCTGPADCTHCNGASRIVCNECSGSGRVKWVYKQHRSDERCPTCHGWGYLTCLACNDEPRSRCPGCKGTSHQLVWLSFTETRVKHLLVHPPAPPDLAPSIAISVPLDRAQFAEQRIAAEIDQPSAITPSMLGARAELLEHAAPPIDPRTSRIARQQYVRLNVQNAEATYDLATQRGHIIFEKPGLTVSSLFTSTRPIKRWALLWALSTLAASAAIYQGVFASTGSSAYFEPQTRATLQLLWLVSSLLVGHFLGGALKTLGQGAGPWFAGIRRDELLAGALGLLSVVAGVYVSASH